MAHPFQEHRQDKVEKSRVSHIAHRASGGKVAGSGSKGDDFDARAAGLTGGLSSRFERKAGGKVSKQRLDRPRRADGGRVKGAKTNVNVIITPGGQQQQPPMPIPVPMPSAAPAPKPPMPPPMPPQMAGGPPPGMPPMPGMPHARGGAVRGFAKGGAVKGLGKVKEEGLRNGTQVTHAPGKNDLDMISSKPPLLTRKKGGAVYPKMKFGSESGEGRLEKARMQKRTYP